MFKIILDSETTRSMVIYYNLVKGNIYLPTIVLNIDN